MKLPRGRMASKLAMLARDPTYVKMSHLVSWLEEAPETLKRKGGGSTAATGKEQKFDHRDVQPIFVEVNRRKMVKHSPHAFYE